MFAASLTTSSRVRAILDVLGAATEFSSIPIRMDEEDELLALYELVPMKLTEERSTRVGVVAVEREQRSK
jgi:hypothetical protein